MALLRAHGAEIPTHMITHVVPFDDAPAFLRRLVADASQPPPAPSPSM